MSALSINKSRYYYKRIFVYKIIPEQNVAVLRHMSCSKSSEHSKCTYFRINTSSLCNLNAYIQHFPIAIQSNPTICLSSHFESDAFTSWKRTSMTIQKYLHQNIDMVLSLIEHPACANCNPRCFRIKTSPCLYFQSDRSSSHNGHRIGFFSILFPALKYLKSFLKNHCIQIVKIIALTNRVPFWNACFLAKTTRNQM